MSTKIPFAFRLPAMKLQEAQNWVLAVRTALIASQTETLSDQADLLVERLDVAAILGCPSLMEYCKVRDAAQYFVLEKARYEKESPSYFVPPRFCLDFEVRLFPQGRKTLGYFQGGNRPLLLDIASQVETGRGRALEYSYWNNTDRPEYVSAAEWRRRRADWDRVDLEAGATFNLTVVPFLIKPGAQIVQEANQKLQELDKQVRLDRAVMLARLRAAIREQDLGLAFQNLDTSILVDQFDPSKTLKETLEKGKQKP